MRRFSWQQAQHQSASTSGGPELNPHADGAGPTAVKPSVRAKAPKLPEFREGRDEIESYLLRFERFAVTNSWPREHWATHLSALLRGKALDTYKRLSEHESTEYDVVKRAILKRYNLTSEGFNDKFRTSRPEAGERVSQFKTRLETYLKRWMELSERDVNSIDEWKDLLIKEQLLNACGKDLRTFLIERKPKRCSELVALAEQYIEAHGEGNAFSKSAHEKKPRVSMVENEEPDDAQGA
ncbi:hypothetical protein ElyMa_006651800 [Elysia marginata]|uniref:SCAN box domain-containing protein n=1 Tax=Elysia marginata TaxID=1093978 RepID=A0AAV4INZ3_9GAST|nr:hypothetical protein ElyMa_006651800 [Elysia marginata]